MRFFAHLLLCVLFLCPSAHAASKTAPAYRLPVAVDVFTWRDGLPVEFRVDEAKCRAEYGRKWREKCAVSLGRPGHDERKVTLKPEVAGRWQWQSGDRLAFIPETPEALAPGATYEVDLSHLELPSFVRLAVDKVVFHALPLAARCLKSEFWTDPSSKAAHRLSASFEFNYPHPAPGKAVKLKLGAGVKAGEAEAVWNKDKDRLNISWTISKLGNGCQAEIIALKAGEIYHGESGPAFRAHKPDSGGVAFFQNVPGENALFKVKAASLGYEKDENLNPRHVLELETALNAAPDEILRNLQVWELPLYGSEEAMRPCDWQLAQSITGDVIKRSRKLEPAPLQPTSSSQTRHRFSLDLENGRFALVTLAGNTSSVQGFQLKKPFFTVLRARSAAPEIGFLQPGNILPLASADILDIHALGVDQIAWRVEKVREPFLALLAGSSQDAFAAPFGQTGLGMENFTQSESGKIRLPSTNGNQAAFIPFNLGSILQKFSAGENVSGIYWISLTGLSDNEEKAWANKMIVATNAAIFAKQAADGRLDCFIATLDGHEPAAGADVSVLGMNGKAVAHARTDANGHAVFPSLAGFRREMKPAALVAIYDGGMAWLPLNDRKREHVFKDSQIPQTASPSPLNIFLFGQRGIYRPGETLYFGCIARDDKFSPLPPDLPLYAELLDPRGVKIWEKIFRAGQDGLSELSWPSPESALSGKYSLNVKASKNGDTLASCDAKIRQFLPEALNLKLNSPEIAGWVAANSGRNLEMTAILRNLYGAPAKGNKLKARVTTSPAQFRFKGLEEYAFADPAPFIGEGHSFELPDMLTNGEGQSAFTIPLAPFSKSSSRIIITAEGYEKSGAHAASTMASFLISPLDKALGWKLTGAATNPRFLPQGQKAAVEFIAIDNGLNKTRWDGLDFSISQRRYATSLIADAAGGFRYDETPVDEPFRSWKIDIPAKGVLVELPTDRPGEYMLLVKNAEGMILAQFPYLVAGNRPREPNAPLESPRMRMRLDKMAFNPGENIKISIAVPYDGTGLFCVERDGVEAFQWFSASAGESIHEIPVPAGFVGQGFVTALFSRSPDSSAIYMEPLASAAAAFTANVAEKDMGLKITAPDQLQETDDLAISISATKPGKAIVFAVDEGILQLDGHALPQPLRQMLEKRSLNVKTLQAMDLLMPGHGFIDRRLASFGGGMEGGVLGGRFQNPFKRRGEPAAVFWSSIIDVSSGKKSIHIPVPDHFIGSLKIMAVGSGPEAAGSAEARTAISPPLVTKLQLPLAVCPDDEFEAAMILENNSGVDLTAALSVKAEAFDILGSIPPSIFIKKGEQFMVPVRMKAGDQPGSHDVIMEVKSGKLVAARSFPVSIRPPAPLKTSTQAGTIHKQVEIVNDRAVYPDNSKFVFSVSASPTALLTGFSNYLRAYPHGCAEQLISRAFGLILSGGMAADSEADRFLERVSGMIREQFNGSGLTLWRGGEADLLLTAYAVDFLLSMREAGLGTPEDILQMLCQSLEYECALKDASIDSARASAYAVWTLARSGLIAPQLVEQLENALEEKGVPGWREDITLALISAAKRHMLINAPMPPLFQEYEGSGWLDEYAQKALHAALLARHAPDFLTADAKKDFFEASIHALSHNAYATFSACQGMRALKAFGNQAENSLRKTTLACAEDGNKKEASLVGDQLILEMPACAKIAINPENMETLYWHSAITGYDRKNDHGSIEQGIGVKSEYLDLAGEPVDNIRQGDEIIVSVKAWSTAGPLKDCALTAILPGGLEMVFPKKEESTEAMKKARHIDRQEDRMIIFTDLGPAPASFQWRVRAGAPGDFTDPGVFCEAMYDQKVQGKSAGGRLRIGK